MWHCGDCPYSFRTPLFSSHCLMRQCFSSEVYMLHTLKWKFAYHIMRQLTQNTEKRKHMAWANIKSLTRLRQLASLLFYFFFYFASCLLAFQRTRFAVSIPMPACLRFVLVLLYIFFISDDRFPVRFNSHHTPSNMRFLPLRTALKHLFFFFLYFFFCLPAWFFHFHVGPWLGLWNVHAHGKIHFVERQSGLFG